MKKITRKKALEISESILKKAEKERTETLSNPRNLIKEKMLPNYRETEWVKASEIVSVGIDLEFDLDGKQVQARLFNGTIFTLAKFSYGSVCSKNAFTKVKKLAEKKLQEIIKDLET